MNKILIKNVNILDGSLNMELKENKDILICEDKIVDIGIIDTNDALIIDGTGKYIIPGLINLHAHLPSSGKISKKKLGDKSKLVKFVKSHKILKGIGLSLGKSSAILAMNSGVTTVRAVGGVGVFDTGLRDKINSGKILGPRLLVSNEAIGIKGGHMDGTVAHACETVEEAVKFVNQLSNEKVDLIKIMITGGVLDGTEPGHPGMLKMSYEMVEAVCNEAHTLGLKVSAHVEGPEGMDVAVKAGVDSIEHSSTFDESLIPLLQERNSAIVITLSPAMPFIELDPDITGYGMIAKTNSEIVVNGIIKAEKVCRENNILVGLGTDAGSTMTTHYNFYKELILYVKHCGVTPNYALHTATLVNAKIAGIENITGSIEIGKCADMVMYNNNPLDDLNELRNPVNVFVRGNLISNPKIKRNKEIDDLIDPLF